MAQYQSPQQQDVATTRFPSMIAAGAGDHLPIGDYSTADYRSAMRFAVPAGWTGWTGITSATLKVYISDHQHVGPKNSSIFCSRMNVPVWTKDQGTQDCESGFSAGNNTQYDDIASTTTDRFSFSSGSSANAAKTLDVTAMVRYYWANNSPLVFVFDNNGTDQYTELWSLGKAGTTYDAVLTINYETAAPPLAPTPTAPAAGATGQVNRPTFSWTHNDPDAQNNAEVRVYDAAGTTLLYTWNPTVGSTQSLVAPLDLVNGTTYQWEVRTSDAVSGYGPYSAKQAFAIKSLPVVTIKTPRKMTFNGAPRLIVEWTTDQPQAKYQVTAPGYDSGEVSGSGTAHTLATLALVSGTAVNVTVKVWNTDGIALTGTASRSFTPRYGLTTHKKTLLAVPTNWRSPVVVSSVPAPDATNGDAALIIEYGSAATAGASVPTAWNQSLAAVPKTQYLHWRAWFIPNHVAGPTLDSIDIPYDSTVAVVDKWGTTRDTPGLAGGWAIDNTEYVYGSRSISVTPSGAATFCYAYKVLLKKDRSYVLTGLMKSVGNSGARIELQNAAGTVLQGGGMVVPPGPVQTKELVDPLGTDWFTADGRDVNRYDTPIYKATVDDEVVYVVLRANGAAGTKAFFDAIKLEESTVATAWSPGAVGATIVDAGGVQIDGSRGGIFRYRGTAGGVRDVVEGGTRGLRFGGEATVELYSPSAGILRSEAQFQPYNGSQGAFHLSGDGNVNVEYGDGTANKWAKLATGTMDVQYGAHHLKGIVQSRYATSEVVIAIDSDPGVASQPNVNATIRTLGTTHVHPAYEPMGLKVIVRSLNPIVWELWFQYPGVYSRVMWFPTEKFFDNGSITIPRIFGTLVATGSLPAGTQYDAAFVPLATGAGTVFPAIKGVGSLFFRTDLGMEFFWNGTMWLTSQLFIQQGNGPDIAAPVAATSAGGRVGLVVPTGITDIYLETLSAVFYVSGGTALSASHKWVGTVSKNGTSGTLGLLSYNIDNGAINVHRRITNAVNALLGAGYLIELDVTMTKTGTPGSMYYEHVAQYRFVAT